MAEINKEVTDIKNTSEVTSKQVVSWAKRTIGRTRVKFVKTDMNITKKEHIALYILWNGTPVKTLPGI